ncbi:MAG TPA: HAD family hydrolase, partial [Glaciihabitans sp.]|nr:HAD family hydrolase [Glaciihabitans sp.]
AARVGDESFATRAHSELAAFAAGETVFRDGYDAVARLAAADEVTAEVVSAAYDDSRALLGTDGASVSAPAELSEFLHRIQPHATIALATNAPGDGVVALLSSWGIADVFDAMHFRVGKPTGLVPILTDALTRGPVLSVGDIHEFDLAPAAQLGADTALVGPAAARTDFAATMRGRSIADLYDQIADWAITAAPQALLSSHTPLSPER